MITPCAGEALAAAIEGFAPGATVSHDEDAVWVIPERWLETARGLHDRDELAFSYLNLITGVDYIERFEVVYHLTSMTHVRSAVIKLACGHGRTEPVAPSVVAIWRGADLMEREVWDLMGIRFEGHPNLKRIMLWEGFEGHPLRKDYLR